MPLDYICTHKLNNSREHSWGTGSQSVMYIVKSLAVLGMVLTQVNEHSPKQFQGRCGSYGGPGNPLKSHFGCHHPFWRVREFSGNIGCSMLVGFIGRE